MWENVVAEWNVYWQMLYIVGAELPSGSNYSQSPVAHAFLYLNLKALTPIFAVLICKAKEQHSLWCWSAIYCESTTHNYL